MTIYILNTLIFPINFDDTKNASVLFQKISIEEAKRIVQENEIVSAVGHEATAKILSKLLDKEIPFNRISIFMKPGDRALHFFLKQRLPEGRILNEEELKNLDYWLVLSERVQ
ncbi:MAG: DUF1874 domain-containing protein [Thermoproteota archaeon]